LENIVRIIKELNPDVILHTGDLFDSQTHFNGNNDILQPFTSLNIPHYFVYGNHDEHVGVSKVIDLVQQTGATVLMNEITCFKDLQIIGLNNMLPDKNTVDFHATNSAETVESVLNKLEIKSGKPALVLHHRPAGVNYMAAKGADLLLAGHTHAGQLFPFTFIAKWMFGYNKGLYKYDKMSIYVSQGVGTIFSPVRLGTNSEITLLKLVPDNLEQSGNDYIENKFMSDTVTITEVSDLVCPWCYIGKSFLDEAIETLAARGITVEVKRNCYLLRSDIPDEGIELASYIKNQLGGYNRHEAHLEAAAQTRNARIANYKYLSNPVNAHRCLIYVRETLGWKAEHEALGFLHRALYEDGKNISSVAACMEEIARVDGFDPSAAIAALSRDAFTQEVLKEDAYAKRNLKVHGVPHFYITANGKTIELDGTVNVARWVQTIERVVR
jgi:predicted MPP superfamily phosphohydrolase/predicted DsbA family dithiol-disulfide isomerase